MKPTFITDEASQDPDVFIPLALRCGISTIELRSVWDKRLVDLSTVQRADLNARLSDAGLSVCCVSTPCFKTHFSRDLEAEYSLLKAYLDLAGELGSPFLRIFSFYRNPQRNILLDEITERLVIAGKMAAGSGLRLLIENGKRTMHSNGVELAELLAKLDTNLFGALWDPGNSIFGGSDPDPVNVGFSAVKRWVYHVHIKDPVVYNGGRYYVELGNGQLDLEGQIGRLVTAGYEGLLSLETHWRPGFTIDESHLDHPYGQDFSKSGLVATESSLRVLSALIRRVAL